MNQQELESPQNESFSRGVAVSFGLHVALILFITVKAAFFTPESIDFSQAIRVDMVGLPEKLQEVPAPATAENAKPALPEKEPPKPVEKKPEPTTPKEKPAPKAEVKEPVKTVKKDSVNLEKKQQSAIEKLKAMAALEKIKDEVTQEKAKPAPGTGKAADAPAKVKGNVLSPGTALTGLSKLQHDNYASDLDAHIKQHWQLPEWLANRDYKAQVRVFIDARGNIVSRKIIKSSGNPSYDDEVLATIDRAAPFPAPPEKFASMVEVDGILIGFPE